MLCMAPKRNTKTQKEASSYAKQMYSLLSSIGQNVCNTSQRIQRFKLVITWFEQSVISVVFKFINDSCQYYLDEVIEFAPKGNIILRNNFLNNIFEIQTLVKKSLIFYWSFVLQSNPRDLKENRQLKYI